MNDMQPMTVEEPQAQASAPVTRRRWGRRLAAMAAIGAAGAVAATGILSRSESEARLTDWTREQAIPTVAVIHARAEHAGRMLTLPGNVEAYNTAPIYARVSGYVKTWDRDIGDHVHAGDTLATLDAPDLDQQLDQARADLANAGAQLRLAHLTAQRWKALLGANAVSVQSADEKSGDAAAKAAAVAAAAANVHRMEALEGFKRLLAPFDGTVIARNTDIGALINAGSGAPKALFTVADTHRMRIYVRVPQAYAAAIQPGQTATLALPQYPHASFTATVVTTAGAVESQSRTVLVELQADNPDGKLWPGTFASVGFRLTPQPGVVVVPASALLFQEHGAQLAVLDGAGRVELRHVEIGQDRGVTIEVLSGVTTADRIIDSPPDSIEAGETVHLASASQAAS